MDERTEMRLLLARCSAVNHEGAEAQARLLQKSFAISHEVFRWRADQTRARLKKWHIGRADVMRRMAHPFWTSR